MTSDKTDILRKHEPRPQGVRIQDLSDETRSAIANFRFEYIATLLQRTGCAVTPDPKGFAINFHTGQNLAIVLIDPTDPRRIQLAMFLVNELGDVNRAVAACVEINASQFAAKAFATRLGSGFELTLKIALYAEELSAFTNSLKAYTDDLISAYNTFIDIMIRE